MTDNNEIISSFTTNVKTTYRTDSFFSNIDPDIKNKYLALNINTSTLIDQSSGIIYSRLAKYSLNKKFKLIDSYFKTGEIFLIRNEFRGINIPSIRIKYDTKYKDFLEYCSDMFDYISIAYHIINNDPINNNRVEDIKTITYTITQFINDLIEQNLKDDSFNFIVADTLVKFTNYVFNVPTNITSKNRVIDSIRFLTDDIIEDKSVFNVVLQEYSNDYNLSPAYRNRMFITNINILSDICNALRDSIINIADTDSFFDVTSSSFNFTRYTSVNSYIDSQIKIFKLILSFSILFTAYLAEKIDFDDFIKGTQI